MSSVGWKPTLARHNARINIREENERSNMESKNNGKEIDISFPEKWISAKDKKPEYDTYVTGWNDKEVIRCKYSDIRKCWVNEQNFEVDVKLWKPEKKLEK